MKDFVPDHHRTVAVAFLLAGGVCERFPDLVTLEFYKKDRKGRLFFDTLRNVAGATFVAPSTSSWTTGRPSSTGQSRASKYEGVTPWIWVAQLRLP